MEKFDKALEWILYIVLFSIFINFKAFFNVGIILLLIISVIKTVKYKTFSKERVFYWYFGVILIGLIANLINGTVGKFLSIERSVFFIPLFLMMNLKLSQFDKVKNSMVYGGIIGAFYSVISYFTPSFLGINTLYQDYRNNGMRMQSFVNVIRWGNLLQILSIYTLQGLQGKKGKVKKMMILFILLLFIFALVINGTRAGMVGVSTGYFILATALLFYFRKKYIYKVLVFLSLIVLLLGYLNIEKPELIERIKSIKSTTNSSNRVRLDLYRAGIKISKENLLVGVGSGNSKKFFNEFIEKQSDEYRLKYYDNTIKVGTGTPFENNYINVLVENGILYFLSLNIFLLVLIMNLIKNIKNINKVDKFSVLVLITTIIGSKIFEFFFPRTDSYIYFIVTYLIFYAYAYIAKKE